MAGGALTAALIPGERRGEGLAVVGLVTGVPSLFALPAGVWAAQRWSFDVVFVVTALAPILTLPTIFALAVPQAPTGRRHGPLSGLREAALMRPAAVFAASACAADVVVTYLPLALRGQGEWIAPAALLLHSAAATLTRWIAGRIGDRRGQTGLLTPGLILSIVGMAALAVTASPWAVLAGAATFGSGFGILQNATLALMYSRVHQTRYSTVSAIWNAAYDLSMAVGAIGAGLLASGVGFTTAFLLTASAMLPALAVAHREATPQR